METKDIMKYSYYNEEGKIIAILDKEKIKCLLDTNGDEILNLLNKEKIKNSLEVDEIKFTE